MNADQISKNKLRDLCVKVLGSAIVIAEKDEQIYKICVLKAFTEQELIEFESREIAARRIKEQLLELQENIRNG